MDVDAREAVLRISLE